MKTLATLTLLAVTSLMAGCAGTAARVQSEYRATQGEKLELRLAAPPSATEEGLQILRDRLTSKLSNEALLATSPASATRTLDVTVTHYRIRHGAVRAMVGIMAGTDNVQSIVRIKDPANGVILSEFSVESKNPTAWGTSRGLLEDHADKIFEILKGGKK